MQPTYLPWIGYFGLIDTSDIFVFYDDVQFEPRSWQQRNRIRIAGVETTLSVPVFQHRAQTIKDVRICNDRDWRNNHWARISQSYSRAAYFKSYEGEVKKIYEKSWDQLCQLNIYNIKLFCELLGLRKPIFTNSSELSNITGHKTDRLLSVLERINASEFITVPGTRDYLEIAKFRERNIKLYWYEFQHPVYPQVGDNFIPYLSAVDLLFNTGSQAINYIRKGTHNSLKLDKIYFDKTI